MRKIKTFKEKFEKLSAIKQNQLFTEAIIKNCIECCGGIKKEAINCKTEACAMKNFNFLVENSLSK